MLSFLGRFRIHGRSKVCWLYNHHNHQNPVQPLPCLKASTAPPPIPCQPPPLNERPPPPPPRVTSWLLFLYGALGSHPFFPLHIASGCCFLSAAAASALAGVVSAFAEPSGWCVGAVLDVAWCAVCVSVAPNNWRAVPQSIYSPSSDPMPTPPPLMRDPPPPPPLNEILGWDPPPSAKAKWRMPQQ